MAFFNITSIKSKNQQSAETPAEPQAPEPETGQLAVDILETSDSIIVLAPIAGIEAKSVKIALSDDVLTITGQRQFPEELNDNERYFTQECYWGEFQRSIVLPQVADTENVKAKFKHGILKVVIPKAEDPDSRVIEIEE